jgi:hypothetical protein
LTVTLSKSLIAALCAATLAAPVVANQGGSRNDVVGLAKSYMGVPYVWAGTSKNGFDCSGFIYEVFRANGYTIPRMADEQFYATRRVQKKEDLRVGDLVFFTTYMPGPSHVGIYLGDGKFIHASSAGGGVITSQLRDGYYSEAFLGGGRPEGYPEPHGAPQAVAVEPRAHVDDKPQQSKAQTFWAAEKGVKVLQVASAGAALGGYQQAVRLSELAVLSAQSVSASEESAETNESLGNNVAPGESIVAAARAQFADAPPLLFFSADARERQAAGSAVRAMLRMLNTSER